MNSENTARIYNLSDTVRYLSGGMSSVQESRTLTIQRSQEEDSFGLIVKLLCENHLTERELTVLNRLVENKQFTLNEQIRKQVSAALGISRENLNNILIRMQAKKFFDKDWNIPKPLHILSRYKEIKTVVVNI